MIQRPHEPDFERFLTAIRGGCPDWVPVAEALVHPNIKAAVLGHPVKTLVDDLAFWRAAGYDYICMMSGILDPGATVGRKRGLGTSRDRYADLDGEVEWAHEHTGLVSTEADVAAYAWPSVEDLVPKDLIDLAGLLPASMKTVVMTGKIFTTAWMMMGFENFAYAVHEESAVVDVLFDRIIRLQVAGYERICAMGSVGGFWFSDDVAFGSSLMVAPKILRRYVFPVYRRMVHMAHQVGKFCIYHSDGQLWPVLEDIISCGFDALHPIEPNAMDILEVRRATAGRISLIGNLDLAFPLTLGTPEDVRAEVHRLITALAPAGGYLVGSANSIPEWVPVENYAAMVQAAFDYGRYPIGAQWT